MWNKLTRWIRLQRFHRIEARRPREFTHVRIISDHLHEREEDNLYGRVFEVLLHIQAEDTRYLVLIPFPFGARCLRRSDKVFYVSPLFLTHLRFFGGDRANPFQYDSRTYEFGWVDVSDYPRGELRGELLTIDSNSKAARFLLHDTE